MINLAGILYVMTRNRWARSLALCALLTAVVLHLTI